MTDPRSSLPQDFSSVAADVVLAEWSRVLIESLADAGIRELVLSPGSRSTPLVWAALRCSRLRRHTVIDERSAAFFALGQAKITGRPALLLCTSGSAAANYLPAIVEASSSATPLVVLTADRPFELQGCAASQTIDQVKLYGGFARHYVDLGMPEPRLDSLRALRRHAAQAVAASLWPAPGPVHIEARARKPLEPPRETSPAAARLRQVASGVLDVPLTSAPAPLSLPPRAALLALADRIVGARSGLIALGPMHPAVAPSATSIARLQRATGFSLYAEHTSQHRFAFVAEAPGSTTAERATAETAAAGATIAGALDARIDALDLLARSFEVLRRGAPDVTLELGMPPVAAAWSAVAAQVPPGGRHVLTHLPWGDPENGAATLLRCSLEPAVLALCDLLEARFDTPPRRRCELLTRAAACAQQTAARMLAFPPALPAVPGREGARSRPATPPSGPGDRAALGDRSALGEHPTPLHASAPGEQPTPRDPEVPALGELEAVRFAVDALPNGGLLAVGNSLPVREVDVSCPSAPRDLMVWSQRGAAGIDGVIAGALGAALAARRPTLLLLGDVSFLHDVGSLALARQIDVPVAITVINNDGGRIFEQLPIAAALRAERAQPEDDGAGRSPTAAGSELIEAWTTPHGLELWRAAELYHLPHRRIGARVRRFDPRPVTPTHGALPSRPAPPEDGPIGDPRAEVGRAIAAALATPGCTLIEVVVPPHDAAERRAQIDGEVERELAALLAARATEP